MIATSRIPRLVLAMVLGSGVAHPALSDEAPERPPELYSETNCGAAGQQLRIEENGSLLDVTGCRSSAILGDRNWVRFALGIKQLRIEGDDNVIVVPALDLETLDVVDRGERNCVIADVRRSHPRLSSEDGPRMLGGEKR